MCPVWTNIFTNKVTCAMQRIHVCIGNVKETKWHMTSSLMQAFLALSLCVLRTWWFSVPPPAFVILMQIWRHSTDVNISTFCKIIVNGKLGFLLPAAPQIHRASAAIWLGIVNCFVQGGVSALRFLQEEASSSSGGRGWRRARGPTYRSLGAREARHACAF